ncbi:hypothetical protein Slala03_81360 [Streptomyces lavendulae subsp. lavendulae]|nr:ATP-binding protein [Streptomyces lavendulae]GLV88447.1 hypothetical protein Slala03_81360 [Streptomyces lavendulae subsp. lavendulae]
MSELVSTGIRNTASKPGCLDFIDLVLSEGLAIRENRRFRTGLRISKLPHHKTLDDYGFSFQPELDPRKIKDLATSPSPSPRPTQPCSGCRLSAGRESLDSLSATSVTVSVLCR